MAFDARRVIADLELAIDAFGRLALRVGRSNA
jgi:hypothetical protein